MNTQASLKKILLNDYGAFLGWVALLFYLGVIFLQFFLGENLITIQSLALVLLPVSLIFIGVLFWRVYTIRRVFEEGTQVSATVVRVSFYRDRGRVEVVYIFQGERYLSRNIVVKNKTTRALVEGMPVIVLVDQGNPRRAFIRELYAGDE